MFMLMMMILLMAILFMFMKHPLSMGIILVIQTMMISMLTGLMIKSFWFSYMILMVLLSGALVLFIYMASIASNEKFNSSAKLSKLTIMLLMLSTGVDLIMDDVMKTQTKMISNPPLFMENEQMMNLLKMFNWQSMQMTLMVVVYLLFTMIVVTYNTNIYEGPMREKN